MVASLTAGLLFARGERSHTVAIYTIYQSKGAKRQLAAELQDGLLTAAVTCGAGGGALLP